MRIYSLGLWLTSVMALLSVACGGETPSKNSTPNSIVVVNDDDMGSDQPDVGEFIVTPGEVSLRAENAFETGIGRVTVPLEIANGLPDAIPVAFTLFRLRAGELEHLPSQLTPEHDSACPIDSLLASGGVLGCTVQFEIPEAAVPTALIFETPEGTVETAVTFVACTRCDGICVDLQTSSSHCGQCGREVPTRGSCEDGEPVCPADHYNCQGYCERNTTECFVDSTRQISCATICGAEDLSCSQVDYYYECTENRLSSAEDLGCDDQPPATRDDCSYDSMDCRCRP